MVNRAINSCIQTKQLLTKLTFSCYNPFGVIKDNATEEKRHNWNRPIGVSVTPRIYSHVGRTCGKREKNDRTSQIDRSNGQRRFDSNLAKKSKIIFLLFVLFAGHSFADIKQIPLQTNRKEPYQFSILPRTVTTFIFPEQVVNVLLGDTTKFTAQPLDDYTVVMKATTTEVGALTGIQVQLSGQQIVSMRVRTSESGNTVDTVQFYKGTSPFQSEINKEKKKLEKDFELYKKDFSKEYTKAAQQIILKEMQDHLYENKSLSASKTVEQITLDAKRYLEVGQYGYLFFEITNLSPDEIEPQNTTLTSIKRNGVAFVEIKDLKETIFCDQKPIKKNQSSKCSIAFSLKNFLRKEEKLKITFPHDGGQSVTDVCVLDL